MLNPFKTGPVHEEYHETALQDDFEDVPDDAARPGEVKLPPDPDFGDPGPTPDSEIFSDPTQEHPSGS